MTEKLQSEFADVYVGPLPDVDQKDSVLAEFGYVPKPFPEIEDSYKARGIRVERANQILLTDGHIALQASVETRKV